MSLIGLLPSVFYIEFLLIAGALLLLPNRLKIPFTLLSGLVVLRIAIHFLLAAANPISFYVISSALSLVLILLIAANYSPKLSNC